MSISLHDFPDLRSVPKHRRISGNDLIERLRLAVPIDYIVVSGLDVDRYRVGEGYSIDTDLPPAFMEAYLAEKLFLVDPLSKAAKSATGVVLDRKVYETDPLPQRLDYLMRMFGIDNRTLVPVRRNDTVYGAVLVTRAKPFDGEEIAFLSVFAEAIHTAVTKDLRERFVASEMKLSAGELACLTQASFGLTSEEIAIATGYQSDTVNSYIKSAVKKMGTSNRTHAIAEAIRRRLIA